MDGLENITSELKYGIWACNDVIKSLFEEGSFDSNV